MDELLCLSGLGTETDLRAYELSMAQAEALTYAYQALCQQHAFVASYLETAACCPAEATLEGQEKMHLQLDSGLIMDDEEAVEGTRGL